MDKQEIISRYEQLKREFKIAFWIPYEQQEEYLRAKARTRLFIAGNRTGKTESSIIEDISWCLGYRPYLRPEDPDFYTPFKPPVHGILTTESLGTEGTAKKVIEGKFDEFLPKSEIQQIKKNQQGVAVYYKFRNGSSLSIGGYEQDVSKFEGSRYHFWHADEPPPSKLYAAIQRSLVDWGGWSWFSMTPVADEAFTIRLFENPEAYKVGPLPMTVNLKHKRKWYGKEVQVGGLTQEHIDFFAEEMKMAGVDPAEIEARLTGSFRSLSGRILRQFNSKIHVVPPFEIKQTEGAMYVAIDPHDYKPWAITFMMAHINGNLYTVDELSMSAPLEEIVSAIEDKLGQYNIAPRITLIDPQAIVEESDKENLIMKIFKASRNHRYLLQPIKGGRGEAPKSQGIQQWRSAISYDEAKGKFPKWFVFSNCFNTIRQTNSWVYDKKGYAIKEDDDFCENHYRLFLIDPTFIGFKTKEQTKKKAIVGIGSQ